MCVNLDQMYMIHAAIVRGSELKVNNVTFTLIYTFRLNAHKNILDAAMIN